MQRGPAPWDAFMSPARVCAPYNRQLKLQACLAQAASGSRGALAGHRALLSRLNISMRVRIMTAADQHHRSIPNKVFAFVPGLLVHHWIAICSQACSQV